MPIHKMRTEPWLVPGANDFLRSYIAIRAWPCRVLEFGAGASTIWFLRQGCRVVSYESSGRYTEIVNSALADRAVISEIECDRLNLHNWDSDVPASLLKTYGPDSFDLVLVDGEDRPACFENSISLVKPNGVLMVDNTATTNNKVDRLPDWDYSCSIQHTPDKFNSWRPDFAPGAWGTSWWRRPGPLEKATHHSVTY